MSETSQVCLRHCGKVKEERTFSASKAPVKALKVSSRKMSMLGVCPCQAANVAVCCGNIEFIYLTVTVTLSNVCLQQPSTHQVVQHCPRFRDNGREANVKINQHHRGLVTKVWQRVSSQQRSQAFDRATVLLALLASQR